jgi:hypothetical protein
MKKEPFLGAALFVYRRLNEGSIGVEVGVGVAILRREVRGIVEPTCIFRVDLLK